MKKFFLLLLCCCCQFAVAQNLVSNPSFEEYIHCPNALNRMDSCMYWRNYGNSPDYFHACNSLLIPPPFGYQLPHSGNAMAGIITWRKHNSPDGPNYREYCGVELNEQLQVGKKYFVSMFINFSDDHGLNEVASNNLGTKFSMAAYDSTMAPPLSNSSSVHSDTIVTDSIGWTLMFGSFYADSAYGFLTVGNFYDDQHTDTLILSPYPDVAYYYIDDVCVSRDSIYTLNWTGISPLVVHEQLSVYPNPATDFVFIKSDELITSVSIFNSVGKLVIEWGVLNTNEFKADFSSLSDDVYLAVIKNRNEVVCKNFFISH